MLETPKWVPWQKVKTHLSHRLLWSLDVCCQQLLQKTSPNLLVRFLPNLAEMILIWLALVSVQMVPGH